MYSLLERSKPAPSLGGVSGVGKLRGGSKQQNIALAYTDEGQQTLTGMYRWLLLCLTAYLRSALGVSVYGDFNNFD